MSLDASITEWEYVFPISTWGTTHATPTKFIVSTTTRDHWQTTATSTATDYYQPSWSITVDPYPSDKPARTSLWQQRRVMSREAGVQAYNALRGTDQDPYPKVGNLRPGRESVLKLYDRPLVKKRVSGVSRHMVML